MSVLDLCDTEVAAVPVDASAAEAIRLMLSQRVGPVGVVDSDHKVAGIFTERDVLRKLDRKSTRLNSSHVAISYAVFCLKKKNQNNIKKSRRATNTSRHRFTTLYKHCLCQ